MNNLKVFADNNRTTTFFKDMAIMEILVAYRIMEYLAPDETFKPDVNENTKALILTEKYHEAYSRIISETQVDISSAHWGEHLEKNAVELMQYMLPIYQKNCTDKKERRKIELLKELEELGIAPH